MQDSIYQVFHEVAENSPDALAVRDESRALTYAELDRLACSIADELPERCRFVGIVMDHGVEMIASILAVLKRGAAYVPAEPTFPVERIQFMLTEADVDAVVTHRVYDNLFREARRVYVERGRELPDESPDESGPCPARPDDLAYVLYTSGTTGTPKGVAVEHRNVLSYVESFTHEFAVGPGDVMLQHSVCSFDIFVEEVFATLLNGAALAIPPEHDKQSAETLAAYIDEAGVTIVDGFPYLLADLNQLARVPRNVRLYVSGGDVLRASYCDRLVEHALVYNTYGPSEITCCASYYRVNGGYALDDGTYPVGKPVLNDRVEIVGPDLNPVAPGEVGEICITGGGVSRGYLGNRPEQANFAMRGGERWYRSGDLGYILPDGNIAFLRREDSQVMIDGRRVECSEVENVLVADPDVLHAVVRAQRDERDRPYMIAYVVPADGDLRISELRSRLGRKLAGFMIPEFFVQLAEIPLNTNGKPDEAVLPVVLK